MIRLALLSFWHVHAADYTSEAANNPDTEIIAAWDENTERGRQKAAAHGWRFHERLDDLLDQPDIDGVIVTTPTSLHPAVIGAALRAAKHVFTEKVLAAAPQDAADLIVAARRANVALGVALARRRAGYVRAIQQLLADGSLGAVRYGRVRISHDGVVPRVDHPQGWLPAHFFDKKEAGGGALIDLGAHPLYLLRELLGVPRFVTASLGFTTGRAVEDQAVVLLHYPSDTIGVAEVSFVAPYAFSIELHGTHGNLVFLEHEGQLQVRLHDHAAGQWTTQPLPDDAPTPFTDWVGSIVAGTWGNADLTPAYDLSVLVDAAYSAAAANAPVALSAQPPPE